MVMSDSAIRTRIQICRKQLLELEANKEFYSKEYYQETKDDLEYEIECWKNQLKFGVSNIW